MRKDHTLYSLMPGIVAVLVLFAGVSVGYTSLIQWQRFQRLASNDDVRYTHELKEIRDGQESLDYGKCTVNIPPDHRVGFVDSPSLQRFEFTQNRLKWRGVNLSVIAVDDDLLFFKLRKRQAGGTHNSGESHASC